VALVRARTRPSSARGVTVVAAAEAGARGKLAPIPYDRGHAAALSGLHGGERSRLLDGPSATLQALRGAELAERRALTIVAHGLYEPTRERPAGLLLAGGEALWCEDVETLRAPALVTLVACGAARAPIRRGDDGRSGLGAAFLRAGAETIVLGAGDLELALGLLLDRAFHERLCAGDPPAEALRGARAALQETGLGRQALLQALLVRVLGLGGERLIPIDEALPIDEARGAGEARAPAKNVALALAGLAFVGLLLGLAWRRR
jgi:hypothetical protein